MLLCFVFETSYQSYDLQWADVIISSEHFCSMSYRDSHKMVQMRYHYLFLVILAISGIKVNLKVNKICNK